MIEVEYDHAHRSPEHRRHARTKECVVCEETNPIEEYGFKLKTYGSLTFHYNLFCPECGDRTIHKDPTGSLVFRFRISR